jgi:hypothetical protein
MPASMLERASDVFGLASGVLLLIPAWRADRALGNAARLAASIAKAARTGVKDPLQDDIQKDLDADVAAWSAWDRWRLRLGAVALVIAFGLKIWAGL